MSARMRTPLVLALVAMGLGIFIWIGGRRRQNEEAASRDARKVLKGFERDKLTALELVPAGGEAVRLEKKGEGWALVRPMAFPADRAAVDELISTLEFLDRQRVIEGKASRSELGLDKPKVTVKLEQGGHTRTLLVSGKEDAGGKSVYVATGDESTIYVVEHRLAEQVGRSADAFKDHRVFALDRSQVKRVQVGAVKLSKERGAWLLAGGVRASDTKVSELLKVLEDLRASRLGPLQVGAPVRELAVDQATVKIGGNCPEVPGEVVAERTGFAPSGLYIKAADLEKIKADEASLRETRPIAASYEDLRQITLQAGGKTVRLAREGTSWQIKEPAVKEGAEEEAVRKWFEDLEAFRAIDFVQAEQAKGALAKAAVVTIETLSGEKQTLTVAQDAPSAKRYARRGQEPLAMVLHAEIGRLLEADPLLFRSRRVLSFVRFDAKRLETRDALAHEIAAHGEGDAWKLEVPLALEADGEAVDKVLSTLADLHAERFAGAGAPASLGGTGARTLTVTVEPAPANRADGGTVKAESHTVEVGADDTKVGGCWAKADGGPVFVLAKDKCEALRTHLAVRKLLTLAEDKLIGLQIERQGGKRESAEKHGPAWVTEGAPAEQAKIDGLVTLLRGLTAKDAVQYGADSGHGLGHPRLTLRIRTEGASEVTLVVGAPAPGKAGGAYARVSGRDVTYLLSKETAESLEKATLQPEKSASRG